MSDKFKLVSDKKLAEALLVEAGKSYPQTQVWLKEQQKAYKTNIAKYDPVKKTLLVVKPSGMLARQFLGELVLDKEFFFSASLKGAVIFFKAAFLQANREGLFFKKPEKVFTVQRRTQMRIHIPFGRNLTIQLEHPVIPGTMIQKRILDVSVGGLAFLIKHTDVAQFPVESIISKVGIFLGEKTINTDLEIRHISPIKIGLPTSDLRIGVRYVRLSDPDQDYITAWVAAESRSQMSKLLSK